MKFTSWVWRESLEPRFQRWVIFYSVVSTSYDTMTSFSAINSHQTGSVQRLGVRRQSARSRHHQQTRSQHGRGSRIVTSPLPLMLVTSRNHVRVVLDVGSIQKLRPRSRRIHLTRRVRFDRRKLPFHRQLLRARRRQVRDVITSCGLVQHV